MPNSILSTYQLYNIDSLVVLLIILTTLSIAYTSNKIKGVSKRRGYGIFALAFFSIGIGYLFQMAARFVLLFKFGAVSPVLLNFVFHFLYESLILIGFFLIMGVLFSIRTRKIFLGIMLFFALAVFSIFFPFVFHISSVVLLSFLTARYYQNYVRVGGTHSFFVLFGFALLLLSNIMLSFSKISGVFYLTGGITTLLAYFILLLNQFSISIYNGAKKN